jgi:protein MPE1
MSNAAGVEGMDMSGMGMGMNMGNMGNMGMNGFMGGWQGGYGQEFGGPMYPNQEMGFQQGGGGNFPQQQQGNAQMRGQKRGRPQDFVQVDQGFNKAGRYH